MGDMADDLMFQEMGLTHNFRPVYKCGYCGMKYDYEEECQTHVNSCKANPKKRKQPMTTNFDPTENMPERIWVCGVGYKQSEELSAVKIPDTYPHKTEYIRRDAAYPVTKEAALEALDLIDKKPSNATRALKTIRALLESASK